jgi:hypothetical protein
MSRGGRINSETICRLGWTCFEQGRLGTMADIVELRPAAAGLDDQVFVAVSEMEGDLRAIDEFADALALISETMEESPHANAVSRLGWEIKHRAQSAEKRRNDLSRLTHPDHTK